MNKKVVCEREYKGLHFIVTQSWYGEPMNMPHQGTGVIIPAFHCGYVALPVGHKFHGVEYDELYAYIEVHGGLTYSNSALPGIDNDRTDYDPIIDPWYLGFDTAHGFESDEQRELDYAINMCKNLIDQLVEES